MSFSSRLSASANFAPKGVNLGMVRQKALKIPQRDIGGARKIFSKTAGKVKTTAQRSQAEAIDIRKQIGIKALVLNRFVH